MGRVGGGRLLESRSSWDCRRASVVGAVGEQVLAKVMRAAGPCYSEADNNVCIGA